MNTTATFGLCAVGAMLLAANSYGDTPPAWPEVSGNAVIVRTNTGETQYTCNYTVTAFFTDGTKATRSGQTDPVVKSSNHAAATLDFGKAVSSANLDRWQCSEK